MMKNTSWKFLLSISLIMLSLNAYADWQCYAADRQGHLWTSTGMTQERASKVALSFCTGFSPNGGCHINDCSTSE